MEIERRVIQREREVIKSALFRVCLIIIALDVEGKRDVCENGGRVPPAVPLRPVFEEVQPVSVVSPVLCRRPFVFHMIPFGGVLFVGRTRFRRNSVWLRFRRAQDKTTNRKNC